MKEIGFAIFIAALVIGLASGCKIENIGGIQGSGTAKTETRNFSGFKEIKAGGAVNLEISAQRDFSLVVETDDNLLEYVKTDVSGNTLTVSTRDRVSPTTKIKVKISMPELTNLDISGASNATIINLKNDSLKINASGASTVKIDGEVKSLQVIASGASGIDAENLHAENARIDISGASTMRVSAANELDATASGASAVTYTQEPKNIKKNASGASSIEKK